MSIKDKYYISEIPYQTAMNVERARKHRYIYFNANKKRKKELLNKLRYKILEYPKKDN